MRPAACLVGLAAWAFAPAPALALTLDARSCPFLGNVAQFLLDFQPSPVVLGRDEAMAEPPITRPSLLVRLRDTRDSQAWRQFVELYAPVVYGYVRRRGLQDADAADLTQEVLRAVARAAGRFDYDPKRGSFRGWLFTIVHRKLHTFHASPQRRERGSGDAAVHDRLEEHAVTPSDENQWNEQFERHVLGRAIGVVRPSCAEAAWQACWRTAMLGDKARDVARSLGMSVAAVYMAKSRVLALLKQRVQELLAEE